MADVTCTDRGHEWVYDSDFCKRCGTSFDDYRNALDKKFRYMPECHCGAEKAGFTTHTHWCPRSEQK